MKERAPWCRSSALAHSLCSFARDPMTSSVLRVVIVGWNAFQRLYLAAGLPPLAVRLEEPLRCAQARRVPKRRDLRASNPNEWLRSSAIRLLALLVRSGPVALRATCLGRHASQSANALGVASPPRGPSRRSRPLFGPGAGPRFATGPRVGAHPSVGV